MMIIDGLVEPKTLLTRKVEQDKAVNILLPNYRLITDNSMCPLDMYGRL